MSIAQISPERFQQLCDEAVRTGETPPVLIDVRTPTEFRSVHAVHARNLPLGSLKAETLKNELNGHPSPTVYFICHSGTRAMKACEQMADLGFENVVCVDGGTKAWNSAGLMVNRGKAAFTLEQQVRVTIGTLTAAGAVMAILVNPLWAVVPAAMGAGLIFAGLTNWCPLAITLSKMPWNRSSSDTDTPAAATTCCSN